MNMAMDAYAIRNTARGHRPQGIWATKEATAMVKVIATKAAEEGQAIGYVYVTYLVRVAYC